MRTFERNNQKLFEQICKLDQDQLLQLETAFLYKYYKKVEATNEYVFAEGDIPIALVAHLDTVFDKPPTEIYYDKEAGVMWSPQGLGADDRAGVFAIMNIIMSGLRPHVIFTTDEEWGGIGARWLIYDHPIQPFKELKYIIELDRANKNDACFYDCLTQDFIDYIEKETGFIETKGLYSDISELCPSWEIPGVNLSIGYVGEHLETERLFVPSMLKTIGVVKELLKKKSPDFKWECNPYLIEYFKNRQLIPSSYMDDFYLEEITGVQINGEGCGSEN